MGRPASSEGPVESRVGLVARKARVAVFGFPERGTGLILAAKVKNVGIVPFEIHRMAFEYKSKQPGEVRLGAATAQDVGRIDVFPKDKGRTGSLQPGEERDYVLVPLMFDEVALIATTLPSTQYWIAAYSGSEEVGRIGGEYLQPFLDRTGIKFHRRALPLFGTLPESDRLAIMKAVAPLRGRESDQWPAGDAEPLDGVPNTFVVRAGEDLGVIVTRASDKSVEIVDIVRPSALELSDQPVEGAKQ